MKSALTTVYLFYTEKNHTKTFYEMGTFDGQYVYPWVSYNTFGGAAPIPQCSMVAIPPTITSHYLSGNHTPTLQLHERQRTHTPHRIAFPQQASYMVWVNVQDVYVYGVPFRFRCPGYTAEQFFLSRYGHLLPIPNQFVHTTEIAHYRAQHIYYGQPIVPPTTSYYPPKDRNRWNDLWHYVRNTFAAVGKHPNTLVHQSDSDETSCMLLQLHALDNEYIHIGATIQPVYFTDDVDHYLCTVTKPNVWFPFIVGKSHKVLFLDTHTCMCKDTVTERLNATLGAIKPRHNMSPSTVSSVFPSFTTRFNLGALWQKEEKQKEEYAAHTPLDTTHADASEKKNKTEENDAETEAERRRWSYAPLMYSGIIK